MPQVKVCFWNIQNYGAGDPGPKWGANSALRNQFIRDFVRDQQIDVLLVMEISAQGNASLGDLVAQLNAGLAAADQDWAGSYCGSALDVGANDPPTAAGQLSFRTDGRSEGYAVLWRTNRTTRFSVVPGLNPIATATIAQAGNPNPPNPANATPLNLSTRGRPAGMVDVQVSHGRKRLRSWSEYMAEGGYVPPNTVPFGRDGNLMGQWPALTMPTTGTRNPAELRVAAARRPAYVVLRLNVAGGVDNSYRLCPVAVYHAPSNADKAEWGALKAGMAREMYVTNDVDPLTGLPVPGALLHCRRTIMGGDFNYSVERGDWPEWYYCFTRDFRRDENGGARCTEAPAARSPNPARRTTVHLLQADHVTPIVSTRLDEYLAHKIDLAFFRAEGSGVERVNVPDVLMRAGAPYAATLQAFHAHLTALVSGPAPPDFRLDPAGHGPQKWRADGAGNMGWHPMLCGSWGSTFEDWASFMNQLNAGQLDHARQAAEFYAIFVSDHLPLVATLIF